MGGGISQDEEAGCTEADVHVDRRVEELTQEVCGWRKCPGKTM